MINIFKKHWNCIFLLNLCLFPVFAYALYVLAYYFTPEHIVEISRWDHHESTFVLWQNLLLWSVYLISIFLLVSHNFILTPLLIAFAWKYKIGVLYEICTIAFNRKSGYVFQDFKHKKDLVINLIFTIILFVLSFLLLGGFNEDIIRKIQNFGHSYYLGVFYEIYFYAGLIAALLLSFISGVINGIRISYFLFFSKLKGRV